MTTRAYTEGLDMMKRLETMAIVAEAPQLSVPAPGQSVGVTARGDFRQVDSRLPHTPLPVAPHMDVAGGDEVWRLGSLPMRVGGASLAFSLVLAPGLIFHSPQTIFSLEAMLGAIFLLGGLPIILIGLAWQALTRPYAVRIEPSGDLTFVCVLDTVRMYVNDIQRIERTERRSNGALHEFKIEYPRGSVTLGAYSELLDRLTTLRPGTEINTKEWDDTD